VTGRDEHAPDLRVLIPEDERIAPVGTLVASGRAEGVGRMPLPGVHAVAARRVHHHLEGQSVVTGLRRVLPGVEGVVRAFTREHDAAGVDVEVIGRETSRRDGLAGFVEVDHVLGHHPTPRHALLRHVARLMQVEEVEHAVFLPRDHVSDPRAVRLVEPSLIHHHLHWLSGYAKTIPGPRGLVKRLIKLVLASSRERLPVLPGLSRAPARR
jgi:hypothetical protein